MDNLNKPTEKKIETAKLLLRFLSTITNAKEPFSSVFLATIFKDYIVDLKRRRSTPWQKANAEHFERVVVSHGLIDSMIEDLEKHWQSFFPGEMSPPEGTTGFTLIETLRQIDKDFSVSEFEMSRYLPAPYPELWQMWPEKLQANLDQTVN